MNHSKTDSKSSILANLRHALDTPRKPFKNVSEQESDADVPSAVVDVDVEGKTLAHLFGKKLEEVLGSYEIVDNVADIPSRIVARVAKWSGNMASELGTSPYRELLSWQANELPMENIEERLAAYGFSLAAPDDLSNPSPRSHAATKFVGLTGVDAAFAGTGSMLLLPGPGKSRSASLLPLHHIALIPIERIYPTFEYWLAIQRRNGALENKLRQSSQWAFVTGPSKSADIELNLTLGVHGPRDVHGVLF